MANGPERSNCRNWPSALRQTIGHRPQRGRVDAEPDMARKVHLDVFGGIGGTQQAGSPVHDAVGARIDRRGRNRQIARDRLREARNCPRPPRPTAPRRAASRWSPAHRWRTDFPASRHSAPSPAPAAPDRAHRRRRGSSRRCGPCGRWRVDLGKPVAQRGAHARRRRRCCGPSARHGRRSRVPSDIAASAPSTDRWRESPAMPAPDGRRRAARASTAATATGWR